MKPYDVGLIYLQSTTICKLPVKIDWLSDTRKFKQNDVIKGEGQVFKGTLVAGEIEFFVDPVPITSVALLIDITILNITEDTY